MGDVDRLLAAFEAGDLRRPDYSRPNFIDVVRAVAAIGGVDDLPHTPSVNAIGEQIGQPRHLVFVLVDGLGAQHFETLPAASWLRTHLAAEIQSVFPSTTGAAVTSLATGLWPAEHGAVGWWTYLTQIRETACILPFIRHRDGTPLQDSGITPAEVFSAAPLLGRMSRDTAVAQPAAIIDSAYSTWFGDGSATIPYRDAIEAVDAIANRVRTADAPTFTYWYTAAVDHASHEHGAAAPETQDALAQIDDALGRLADGIAALDAAIVLTADHGHRDAGIRSPIERDDPLTAFLRTPPSGDMRIGYYHLQDGARQAFSNEFRDRFGDRFALITTQELDDLRLLGPHPLLETTRRRVGDYTSLALDDSVMRYTGGSDGDHFMHQRSHHSGLSPAEMTIPLVIG